MSDDRNSSIQVLTSANFDEVVTSTPHLIVDFWAEWCQPCHAQDQVLEELVKEGVPPFEFAKVDVAAYPELPARFGISSVPSLVIFRDHEPARKLFGAKTKRQIQETLARYVS